MCMMVGLEMGIYRLYLGNPTDTTLIYGNRLLDYIYVSSFSEYPYL